MQDLTTGSLTGHLLKTTSFMLVSMIFQTLYVLVDLFWVGRLGTDAIAAVGLAGNLSFIVIAITQVLGVGTVGRIGLRCARAAVLGLGGLSLMAFSTNLPNASRGQVSLTRTTPATFSVALASSNPAVASVPPSVAVSAGQSSASFTIRAVATGCTIITASADNKSSVEPFVVQFPPQGDLTQFELGTPNQPLTGGTSAQGSVRVGGRAGQTVALASSNPSVVAVPATVTTSIGGIAGFPIRAVGGGCATITATLGSLVYRRVIMVEDITG